MTSESKSLFGLEREAWIRFFIALAGLVVAFACAIFSTAMRQAGSLWGTAILASLALVLAGGVGLTTVPYLARRVALAQVRDAFDYDVTREGMVYLALALVIGVAALNTGNNLLFIILAAMLAAVIVSGFSSAMILRRLQLSAYVPEHVFAGSKVIGRLALRNPRRFLPSFSVSVVPPRRKTQRRVRWQHSVFAFPRQRPWLRLPDVNVRLVVEGAAAPGVFTLPVYFPLVPPRGTESGDVELTFLRRGRYAQQGFGIATRFPFSFLVKTRRMELAREVVVYPPVEPTDELFEVLPMITGEFEAFTRGRGYDLYRIRGYVPEDTVRHVDWKATAKTGDLMVREFTREDERKLRIVFDNPAPGAVSPPGYERAVALAASLAWHFAAEDAELSFLAPGLSSDDVYAFLHYLALVEPAEGVSVLDHTPLSDEFNVVFTSRARGSIPTALWASGYFVFLGE